MSHSKIISLEFFSTIDRTLSLSCSKMHTYKKSSDLEFVYSFDLIVPFYSTSKKPLMFEPKKME